MSISPTPLNAIIPLHDLVAILRIYMLIYKSSESVLIFRACVKLWGYLLKAQDCTRIFNGWRAGGRAGERAGGQAGGGPMKGVPRPGRPGRAFIALQTNAFNALQTTALVN